MNPSERAADFFARGYSCSQSVLLAFAEQFHLDLATAARISSGLGGGIGRQGLTCGAVTGGILVIGMQFSSLTPEDKAAKEQVYALVRQFSAQYAARHGAISCSGLLDCDISTPEGQAFAREKSLFKTRCPELVRDAAEILKGFLPS